MKGPNPGSPLDPSPAQRREELADERDRVADARDNAADRRDDAANLRDRYADELELVVDVSSLRGTQVHGPWGYRFGAVEHGPAGAIRAQVIDADGHEVVWAKGDTKADVLRDASRKLHEHESTLDKS